MVTGDVGVKGAVPVEPDCWTPRRTELHGWLHRNAPSLAELYEGAIRMMFVSPVPGKIRFVAHAIREIRNRLPDAISGAKSSCSLQYKNRLDDLTKAWVRSGLPADGSLPSAMLVSDAAEPGNPDIPVDRRVLIEVAGLVRDHMAARERPEDAAIRLFEGIAPENRALRDSLRPVIRQWLSVTERFVGRVHDSGQTDAESDADELRAQFELFETILGALVRRFFSTVEELDEILEDTNS
jgi:hypothetical protein